MAFYPEGTAAPASLRTSLFLLRPLLATDVDLDCDAVMSSRAELRRWSQSTWPAEDFTRAENLDDLERHEREHRAGEAFTYTVLTPDGSRCLGCVYVAPLRREEEALLGPAEAGERRARVTFWVRASDVAHDLDLRLFETLRAWFARTWSFDRIIFTAAKDEARQQKLFRDAGLVHAGDCALADGRAVRVFAGPPVQSTFGGGAGAA
jgi:hypothetical protein